MATRGMMLSLLLAVGVAGCYTYHPVVAPPVPRARLALVLNDQGRVGAASQVGPQVAKVEGALVAASDTAYVLSVAAVQAIFGARSSWTGETVSVRRDYVALAYERRPARGRTAFLLASAASALLAFAFTTNLFGLGADTPSNVPPDGGGGQNQ